MIICNRPGIDDQLLDLPGLAELAVPMKSLRDAIQLRGQSPIFRQRQIQRGSAERQSSLTFVVACGGFAGVNGCGFK